MSVFNAMTLTSEECCEVREITFSSEQTTLFVNKLLERGASPSFTLSDLNTALHLAAAKGHTAVAHSLVEYNAIVDAKNKLNETPLEIAIKNCKNDFATFLVKSMRPGRYRSTASG